MTDRGVIFSAPMVKALIAGRKTATRRLSTNANAAAVREGDFLWVRENFRLEIGFDGMAPNTLLATTFRQMPVWHEADCGAPDPVRSKSLWGHPWGRLRPSIHMPRWASRLTLAVSAVRTHHLFDLTEEDARREGVEKIWAGGDNGQRSGWRGAPGLALRETAREAFADLWSALNKNPGRNWSANPEVIAIEFSVSERNIDGGDIKARGAA